MIVSAFQQAGPVTQNASPIAQEPSTQSFQPDVFSTPVDDGGFVQDLGPLVESGVDDVHMVDAGTPIINFSSQKNTTVLALPNRNTVVGVPPFSCRTFEADF